MTCNQQKAGQGDSWFDHARHRCTMRRESSFLNENNIHNYYDEQTLGDGSAGSILGRTGSTRELVEPVLRLVEWVVEFVVS